jgi:hypothetical protein
MQHRSESILFLVLPAITTICQPFTHHPLQGSCDANPWALVDQPIAAALPVVASEDVIPMFSTRSGQFLTHPWRIIAERQSQETKSITDGGGLANRNSGDNEQHLNFGQNMIVSEF